MSKETQQISHDELVHIVMGMQKKSAQQDETIAAVQKTNIDLYQNLITLRNENKFLREKLRDLVGLEDDEKAVNNLLKLDVRDELKQISTDLIIQLQKRNESLIEEKQILLEKIKFLEEEKEIEGGQSILTLICKSPVFYNKFQREISELCSNIESYGVEKALRELCEETDEVEEKLITIFKNFQNLSFALKYYAKRYLVEREKADEQNVSTIPLRTIASIRETLRHLIYFRDKIKGANGDSSSHLKISQEVIRKLYS